MKYDIYERYYDEEAGFDKARKYIADGEEQMLDTIFSLHETEGKISKKADGYVVVHQHVDIGNLVFNRNTHEVRRVRRVYMHTVDLYNSDDREDCRQQDGLLGTFKETWRRDDIIVIEKEQEASFEFYRSRTELGGYPKFAEYKRNQYMN